MRAGKILEEQAQAAQAVGGHEVGVVEEGDQTCLGFGAGVRDVRAVEGVGLPEFVGVGLGEGQPVAAFAVAAGLEQVEAFDQPGEGVGRDPVAGEHALLDAQAVEQRACRGLAMRLGQDGADGLEQHLAEQDRERAATPAAPPAAGAKHALAAEPLPVSAAGIVAQKAAVAIQRAAPAAVGAALRLEGKSCSRSSSASRTKRYGGLDMPPCWPKRRASVASFCARH